MSRDDGINPILFGVTTAIILGAVYTIGDEIWQAIKRAKESKSERGR